MNRATIAILAGVLLAALGCAGPQGLAENWGTAVQTDMSQQVANPSAGEWDGEAPMVLDGVTGEQVMKNYRKTEDVRESTTQAIDFETLSKD